ncbi:hypothetical protein [Streptomyces chiangmaiensis]|uniref:Secreted protein n=1 Tax=Streptomyces chiangmaiensis TaxID=766497 RepID=A0ABU7FD81_9ACTN|nr:hypothetical protein [Streptomyces chiangmaiensis]MED7822126.1 hypothetical protein [Streptomyces chiangmaiensis]
MTLPTALPFAGAALRTMRTAAGRRALHLALLVGGLLALGFLCEGQAQAADGTPPASAAPAAARTPADAVRPVEGAMRRIEKTVGGTVGRTVKDSGSAEPAAHRARPVPPAGSTRHGTLVLPPAGRHTPSASRTSAARPDDVPVTRPAAPGAAVDPVASVVRTVPEVGDTLRQVVRPVVGKLLQPVGDTVVQPVGGLVQTVTEGLPDTPAQPSLPSLPTLSELPELPVLPGLPASPVHTLPAPSAPQQPGGERGHPSAVEQRKSEAHAFPAAAVQVPAEQSAPHARHAARSPQMLVHQAPGGDPGTYGDQPAADGGVPRHGDAHAVAFSDRAPLPLMRGATTVVTADGTRDRHRGIPEFPG